MIDIKELRIGNWYIDPANDEPMQWEWEFFKDMEFEDSYIGDPIPITDEWLLKLEFTQDRSVFFLPIGDYRIELMVNAFSNHEDGEWFVSIKGFNDNITFTKRYIHQLQNFVFALSDNELKLKQ